MEERLSTPGYANPANRTVRGMPGVAPGADNFTPTHNPALVTESRIVSTILGIPNVVELTLLFLFPVRLTCNYHLIMARQGFYKNMILLQGHFSLN